MPYTGECQACGWCCRNQASFYATNAIRDEFMLARGWKRIQRSKDGKLTMWLIKHACPNLRSDNKCKVYDKRPVACKVYPHSLDLESVGMDAQVGLGRKCSLRWRGE